MDFKKYEEKMCEEIKKVVDEIIKENPVLDIPSKSRAGAEISDFLEENFAAKVNNSFSKNLKDGVQSPPGATKNPFDAKCIFTFEGREELVWIDFKACKITSADSNPDIGTPKKVVKFIEEENFYIMYVIVYYTSDKMKTVFSKFKNEYVNAYLLKDVNASFRINSKPQMQVNISAEPEYRTREEFIVLFAKKQREAYDKQIKIATKGINEIDGKEKSMLKSNRRAEKKK